MKKVLYKSIISLSMLAISSFAYADNSKYICNNKIIKTKINKTNHSKQINFTNWADYISPDIIPCFSKLSGDTIKYIFTSDDNMTRTKVMTGSSGFDLIEQGALYLPSEIKAKALLELDKSKLPNLKYVNKIIYKKISEIDDFDNKHSIVYSYGTTGLAYNKQEVAKRLGEGVVPNSWKYVFNPKFLKKVSPCGVSLLDEPEQVYGNYFHYAGIDPNTDSKAEYEKATLYLIKNVRPYIKYFDSNKYQNDFTAANLCLVMGYSGDVIRSVQRAQKVNPDFTLQYLIPFEGTSIWFDMLMVPKGAKNLDAVYEFLNYTLNPYVAAQNSNYLYQPNAIKGSQKYMIPLFDDRNVSPTDEMLEKMYVLKIHNDEMQAFISKMWVNLKYGIEFTPQYYKPNKK